MQWAWDKAIPALTRHLEANPNSWLKWLHPANGVKYAGLDESLFQPEHTGPHQLLTQQRIDSYTQSQLKQLEGLKGPSITDALKAQAKVEVTSIADHARQLVYNGEKNVLAGKYSGNAVKRTIISGAVPAILVGIVLPLIIQVLQRGWIQDEKEKKAAQEKHIAQEQQAKNLLAHWKQQQTQAGISPAKLNSLITSRFGNMMAPLMNTLRHSTIANTLLVDGIISGGRVVTALNWLDALENFLEETGVIAFLFVFRKKIQYGIEGFLSKGNNFLYRGKALLASLETPQIKWLIEKMHLNPSKLHHLSDATINTKGAAEFVNQLKAFKATFADTNKINLNDYKPHWLEKIVGGDTAEKWVKRLTGKTLNNGKKLAAWEALLHSGDHNLEHYLLSDKTDNWFYELAKEEGYIAQRPVFTAPKGMAKEAAKALESYQQWDFLQKIKYDRMHALAKTLSDFADRANITGKGAVSHWSEAELKNIAKLARHSMGGKGVAFLVSLIISSAFIGWIIPKGRQYITYLVSGSHEYPGALKDGQR